MPPHAGGIATPLSDYVNAFLRRTQMSQNAFVVRCVDPLDRTHVIYNQWMDRLLAGQGPMPELWRLRALAAGMGVDLDVVRKMAIAQWLDFEIEEVKGDSEVIIVPLKRPVTEARRARIRRMVELLAEEDD